MVTGDAGQRLPCLRRVCETPHFLWDRFRYRRADCVADGDDLYLDERPHSRSPYAMRYCVTAPGAEGWRGVGVASRSDDSYRRMGVITPVADGFRLDLAFPFFRQYGVEADPGVAALRFPTVPEAAVCATHEYQYHWLLAAEIRHRRIKAHDRSPDGERWLADPWGEHLAQMRWWVSMIPLDAERTAEFWLRGGEPRTLAYHEATVGPRAVPEMAVAAYRAGRGDRP